ncbi:MAG: TIGR03663 family protein, partial [Planctomycetota bacterium]
MTDRLGLCILVLVVALAAALRLPRLADRPMHLDEAIHTVKVDELWRTGRYVYDPEDYHGPTLYYATLPALWLSGARDFAATSERLFRVVPAVFGCLTVLLPWLLRDALGRGGALAAALLLAVAPLTTYYSRYYIQETLLAFFTLLTIAAAWRYVRCRRARRAQRWAWALLAGASLGLMHATKETSILALGAMGAALLAAMWWVRHKPADEPPASRRASWREITAGLALAVLISATLYSGFFSHPQGIVDSVRTYAGYFDRAGGHGLHDHPWWYYLRILAWVRYPTLHPWTHAIVLALAAIGAGVAGASHGDTAAMRRFLLVYTLVLTAAYTVISYKTPWCMLSFVQAMMLLGGLGAAWLFERVRGAAGRTVVAVLLIAGVGHLGMQSLRANDLWFDDDPRQLSCDNRNPFAYAHAVAGVRRLVDWIDQLAAVHPAGRGMVIKVIVPEHDYWPLPWYLRAYPNVGYWDRVTDEIDADVVIVGDALLPAAEERMPRPVGSCSSYG